MLTNIIRIKKIWGSFKMFFLGFSLFSRAKRHPKWNGIAGNYLKITQELRNWKKKREKSREAWEDTLKGTLLTSADHRFLKGKWVSSIFADMRKDLEIVPFFFVFFPFWLIGGQILGASSCDGEGFRVKTNLGRLPANKSRRGLNSKQWRTMLNEP